MGNFSPATASNFQKLLPCHRVEKNATRLQDTLAIFADGKNARILRIFNISAMFQKMLHCQHKTCYTQKFLCVMVMQ